MVRYVRCACGARSHAAEITDLGEWGSTYIGAQPVDPCTCPRCVSCGHVLAPGDVHPSCENLDCPLLGVWQLVPA